MLSPKSLETSSVAISGSSSTRAPERSQVDAGSSSLRPSSNTGLSIFAPFSDLGLSDADIANVLPKTVRVPSVPPGASPDQVITLHLGFDTVHWSYRLSDEQFARLNVWCDEAVRSGKDVAEIGSFEELGVRRIKYPYAYRVTAENGLAWHIPAVKTHPLMVIAGPKFLLSVAPGEIERDAWCWTCELMNQPELGENNGLSLSRNDVALDLLMSEKQFQKLCYLVKTRNHSVITRAREIKSFMNGDRDTGFMVGKGAVSLRCYDKVFEAAGDDLDFWMKVWNNPSIPDGYVVVRLEYQQRRDFLKSFKTDASSYGITTLEQYRSSAPLILIYLTQAWFRLAGKERGKENYRYTTRFWQSISNAFVAGHWYSMEDVVRVWRDVRRFVSNDEQKMLAMAAGCIATASAIIAARQADGVLIEPVDVLAALEQFIDKDRDAWDSSVRERLNCIVYNLPR